jgi:hypothetical protein
MEVSTVFSAYEVIQWTSEKEALKQDETSPRKMCKN